MPLWLLGLLVAGGISLIVWLVHAGGGSKRAELADEAAALARWAEDFPEDVPQAVLMSRDSSTALLRLNHGTGLVTAIGDSFLTRQIYPTDIAGFVSQGSVFELRLTDFTYSGGSWTMQSEADAVLAADWLKISGASKHA